MRWGLTELEAGPGEPEGAQEAPLLPPPPTPHPPPALTSAPCLILPLSETTRCRPLQDSLSSVQGSFLAATSPDGDQCWPRGQAPRDRHGFPLFGKQETESAVGRERLPGEHRPWPPAAEAQDLRPRHLRLALPGAALPGMRSTDAWVMD